MLKAGTTESPWEERRHGASPLDREWCFPAPGGGGATLHSALAALTTFPACSCPPRPGSRCPRRPVCLPPGGSARLLLLCALRRAAGTVRVELALEAASGTPSPSPSPPGLPQAGAGAADRKSVV